jgi:hypothetical protein
MKADVNVLFALGMLHYTESRDKDVLRAQVRWFREPHAKIGAPGTPSRPKRRPMITALAEHLRRTFGIERRPSRPRRRRE